MQEAEIPPTSVEQQTEQTIKTEDISEKDHESDIPDDDNDDESKGENYEGFNGSGRTVTLQMLLAANVLQPGKSTMTIEYLGQKFVGDLLPDGKIKSQETETIFLSPSAWAMHCKRIINPEKKSGCGWASVKYKGKKLDAYKATWMRKCAMQKESTPSEDEPEAETEKKPETPPPPLRRPVLPHNSISNRNVMHDANILIETVPFSAVNKMQPFLLAISSSALLLADFHCHITFHEVCGYFGGVWDVNSHTLTITKAYPCKNTRHDRQKAAEVEFEIQKSLMKDQLILVGWYHSHPKFQAQPTLRDCDAQLDYQIKLRGPSDVTYTPCIGFLFSPYYIDNPSLDSSVTSFWVAPPPENRQMIEYGRPMLMQFSVNPDSEIPADVKNEMASCVEYYSKFRNELVIFAGVFKDEITYLEKLKSSLYSKFPQKQDDKEFWNWLCRLLNCEEEEEFAPPKNTAKIEPKEEPQSIEVKEEDPMKLDKGPDLKVLTLQEQLCLPSGLNMNPTRLSSPLAATNNTSSTNNATTSSSPRDSPITIPSNSASPAKFEIPVRASPSPAKSDTSSSRTRNSPAPSPGKFSISDISRNSPSVTPNKYEQSTTPSNDLMAASLASIAGQLPSNFLSNDLNAFFQQQQKDYGSSSLNQLAAAAAKVGGKPHTEQIDNSGGYSNNFNMPGTSKTSEMNTMKSTPKSSDPRSSSKSSLGASYKTKLMKELEDLKNDPIKISELMRSPEYAALLLQQAEALGATTLGSLGFGTDFSFLANTSSTKKSSDYANLIQASKLLGYDAYMQQAKTTNDLNSFFQQQMGGMSGSSSSNSSKKQQQQQQQQQQSQQQQQQQQPQADYTTLLQTYSKLFESPSSFGSKSGVPPELSALLSAGTSTSSSSKKKDTQTDMLNQLLQADSSLLYHQNKAVNDLNALFVPPASTSTPKSSTETSNFYSQLAQEKMQDYAALFQHHGKYGIPDPLSKSTLAANNMFMPPSALLKLQQESINAMMMKPPKSSLGSSSSSGSRARESSASPAQERLTPTKSNRESPASVSGIKYNFSAVDLAVSSVPPSTPSPSPSEGSRKPSDTPPVDLSRLYQDPPPMKKRMEFSSIADLAAPPPAKMSKPNDRDEVLNLSSNDQ